MSEATKKMVCRCTHPEAVCYFCSAFVRRKTLAEERLIKAALRWQKEPDFSKRGLAGVLSLAARAVARERGRRG